MNFFIAGDTVEVIGCTRYDHNLKIGMIYTVGSFSELYPNEDDTNCIVVKWYNPNKRGVKYQIVHPRDLKMRGSPERISAYESWLLTKEILDI